MFFSFETSAPGSAEIMLINASLFVSWKGNFEVAWHFQVCKAPSSYKSFLGRSKLARNRMKRRGMVVLDNQNLMEMMKH